MVTTKEWFGRLRDGLLLLVFSGALCASAVAQPSLLSGEHMFELEYASDPQISPDGKTIVYARRSMNKTLDRVTGDLWRIDVASGEHRPLVSGGSSASSPRFSPDGGRLVYLDASAGKLDLKVIYLDTQKHFSLTQLDEAPGVPSWSPDGTHLAFSLFVPSEPLKLTEGVKQPKDAQWAKPVRVFDDLMFRFNGAGYLREGSTQIFVVPAEGGTARQLTTGEGDFTAPVWLNNQELVFQGNTAEDAELDPIESDLYAVNVVSGKRRQLTQRDGPDGAPVVSPDGTQIAYLGFDDAIKSYQQNNVYLMAADGTDIINLTAEFDHPVGALQWRSDGGAILSLAEMNGELVLVSIPVKQRRSNTVSILTRDVGGTSLGRPYMSGEFSVAARTGGARPLIAYTQASLTRPAEVAYLRAGGPARTLTSLNEDLFAGVVVAPIEKHQVKSKVDQKSIDAWVALPANFAATASAPMILEIHGGPFAMYGPAFSAEIQRYAAAGYVTVYANPRGSTGYGEEFAQLIDLAYPGDDHEDLMSVVDYLIEKKYVDPERLFITGGSGGGLLTAWAVGKTDRFVAAATIKPVINWATMALSADISSLVTRHWLRALPWERPEHYQKFSPISLVGNVVTPTLVMVGEEDWRTPTWEAEQFYTALKLRGIDTALVRIPGASHSITARPSRLISKVDNILGWFARYDKD